MRESEFAKKTQSVFEQTVQKITDEHLLPFPKIYQENFIQVASKIYPKEFYAFAKEHQEMFECNVDNGVFDKCFATAKEAIEEYENSSSSLSKTFDRNLLGLDENSLTPNLIDLKNDVSSELKKSKVAIKKLKKDVEALQSMVKIDYLTKLLNRKTFDEDVEKFVNDKDENGYIIVIDIDDFKHVNDTYGHNIGDKTLVFLAEVLKTEFRNDTCYRYGGEEFAILIHNITKENLIKRVESLMQKIRKSCLSHKGFVIRLTISAGVARLQKDDTPESFFDRADAMLLKAKNSGKDKLEFES